MIELQNMSAGERYEIKLQGHLDESWADWFDGLTFVYESDGTTILRGQIIDQTALHGLLKKIRDLSITLLAVNRIEPKENDATCAQM